MSKDTLEKEFEVGTIFYFSNPDKKEILASGIIYEEGGKYTITTPISSGKDFMDTTYNSFPRIYGNKILPQEEGVFEELKNGRKQLFSNEVLVTEKKMA